MISVGQNPWDDALADHVTPGSAGRAQLMSAYAGSRGPGVYVDTYYPGTAGTVLGLNGTPNNPAADLVQARTIADALGVRVYYIVGLTALTATHQDWLFVGSGHDDRFDAVALGGQDCFGATFIGMRMTGSFGAAENAGNVGCVDCELSSIGNLVGTLRNCTLRGANNMPTGAFSFPTLQLIDCTELPPFGLAAGPSIGCGGAAPTDAQIYVSGYRGRLTFTDIANLTTIVQATFDGADVVFDASCTAAISPRLLGDFRLTNAGAVTPDVAAQNQEVADDVLTAAHGAGSWTTV